MRKRPLNVAIVAVQNGWFVGPPFRYDMMNDHQEKFSAEWCEAATYCQTPDAVAETVKGLLTEQFDIKQS